MIVWENENICLKWFENIWIIISDKQNNWIQKADNQCIIELIKTWKKSNNKFCGLNFSLNFAVQFWYNNQ